MLVLGIETSCDETGVALYDADQRTLLADRLHTQASMHAEYGGVVPELASRDHVRRLTPLLRDTLQTAGCTLQDVGAIAFTQGPGLAGALLTGAAFAAGLARARRVPLVAVHHLEAHLLSPLLDDPDLPFPFLVLLVSGGHTMLLDALALGQYRLLGESVDDAAGEAYDKCAKLLGLGYPGGPQLAACAKQGRGGALRLPRPLLHSGDGQFSFSGLKTAVAQQVRARSGLGNADDSAPGLSQQERANLALEVQTAINEVLLVKTEWALRQSGRKSLIVCGGVSANTALREGMAALAQRLGVRLRFPPLRFATDNGAMVALAAAWQLQAGLARVLPDGAVSVRPRWALT